ncbi:hypothetical protein NQT62_09720 [Limnobacter humi]|uniref:Transmembrane protein n=1 Tax=Limnobacter humi TaxID=1778671 RepID=A0ABT1WJV4_9BURK|nr:hypothetical protein [Limnobacter humi]MCQ8896709.1 hypothetical protein [Limnobacter humi]
MSNLWQTINRTPGVLTIKILTIGFLVAGLVTYINGEESAGPYLLAAAALVVTEVLLIIIQLLRKSSDSSTDQLPPK